MTEALFMFDNDAKTLAELWFDMHADERTVRARAQGIVAVAQACGEPRTASMSLAFEAMRAAVLQPLDASQRLRAADLLQALDGGACPRALWLAQAAWAHTLAQAVPDVAHDPLTASEPAALALQAELARATRLLQEHGPPETDARPPRERFWTDAGLCLLHALAGRAGQAIACGRRAQTLARRAGHDLLQAQAAQALARAFLRAGDAGRAAALMREALEGLEAQRLPLPGAYRALLQRVLRLALDARDGLPTQSLLDAADLARAAAEHAEQAGQAAQQQAAHRRFLAHVAHEMRNPAAGIAGLTSLLLATELAPEQRHLLQLVEQAAQMLTGLCNDLLDLARLEAGGFALRPAAIDAAQLLITATQTLAPLAQAKQLALSWTVADGVPARLLCDGLRLQQLLLNLLSNAIKFTAQGAVSVQVEWLPCAVPGTDAPPSGVLRVAVRDTGAGLDAQAQARLFVEFSQIEPPQARGHAGHGLGLALCRGLVQRMGGEIGVDSQPGAGSCFWFTLPLRAAQSA